MKKHTEEFKRIKSVMKYNKILSEKLHVQEYTYAF